MTTTDDSIEFHQADEWTAVYLNGVLERVGDHYLADEWLQDRFNVKVVQDDAFMRGGNTRSDVAQTLSQVEEYRADRDLLLSRAAALREQAAELEAEAARVAVRATSSRMSGLTPGGSCRD